MSPSAASAVRALMGNDSLASVAVWADDQRNKPGWAWSTPLHYANTPFFSCNFVYERDCPGDACVVGAIANYTSRVVDRSLDLVQRQQALYFLVHLCGDIHQPLHVSYAEDQGGNLLTGTFFGAETELHGMWDTDMIVRRLVDAYGNQTGPFVRDVERRLAGEWKEDAARWAGCNPAALPASHRCTTAWANEGARLTCTVGETNTDGQHIEIGFALGEQYYDTALPVIERRIAQGGVRLANLLNRVFE